MTEMELCAQAYQQLPAVSAVLGGLVFTAAAWATRMLTFNWTPPVALIGGVFVFLMSVGASGWIGSRRLGVVTTVVAAAGVVARVLMVAWFGNVRFVRF